MFFSFSSTPFYKITAFLLVSRLLIYFHLFIQSR